MTSTIWGGVDIVAMRRCQFDTSRLQRNHNFTWFLHTKLGHFLIYRNAFTQTRAVFKQYGSIIHGAHQ